MHNARMTTVSEPVAGTPRSSSPIRGALLGTVLILLELLWARYALDADLQFVEHAPRWWKHHVLLSQWVFLSVPFLGLAIAAGLGARSATRGLVAVALCLLGIAFTTIGSHELDAYVVRHSTPVSTLRTLDYAIVMSLTSVAALAWCVSRRRGHSWLLPAVLVASAGAALAHWWDWSGPSGPWGVVAYAAVNNVLPVLLACLVAWAIDARSSRLPVRAPTQGAGAGLFDRSRLGGGTTGTLNP